MSDITHSDYCPEDNSGELEDCPGCLKREAETEAYWGALYAREQRYTREEVEDSLSDPTEYAKREISLSRLGEEL
jgi:hypothetical protein